MPDHSDLSKQEKKGSDKPDAGRFLNVMYRTQRANAGNPGSGAEKSNEQRRMEDQKLAEEFEIHIEDLKNEAIKQFDKELYEECLGTFRFLCELDPNNQLLRDYRELCEKLSGGSTLNSSKERSSSSCTVPTTNSLDGSLTTNEMAGHLSPEGLPGEKNEMQSRKLIAGDKPIRFENSTSAELSDKSEILELPDYGIRPPSIRHTGNRATRPLTTSGLLKSLFRFRPKSYKLVLSIAGILVLAAILGLPSRVHRRQDFPGPTPVPPIDRRGSQSLQGTSALPGQTEAYTVLLGKAEEAKTAGRYVHPSDNNAVAYSNKVLKVDPQNKKALDLKNTSLNHAVDQARELARIGKTAEARESLSSLLEMSQLEDSFPLSSQMLKEEIRKLEITTYTVAHIHFFGSCKGLLRFNSYVITFEPIGESNHGFSSSLTEIRLSEPGSRLKIVIGRRTYRFESGSGTSGEEKRQKLKAIYQAITSRSERNPG